MFVKPRTSRDSGGSRSAAGLFLVVVGAIVFVRIVQGYMEHMMPIVTSEQAAAQFADPSSFCGNPYASTPVYAASEHTSATVRNTILDQLSAVRNHHYRHALDLTSPDFCSSSPGEFGQMVTKQFPELIGNKEPEFSETELNELGTVAVEEVTVKSHQTYPTFTYLLVKKDESWRVSNLQRGSWMPSMMESSCGDQPSYTGSRPGIQ